MSAANKGFFLFSHPHSGSPQVILLFFFALKARFPKQKKNKTLL